MEKVEMTGRQRILRTEVASLEMKCVIGEVTPAEQFADGIAKLAC